jgi:signal transduction histidine kinase
MRIRSKTLLIISATLIGLLVILYVVSQYNLVRSFANLEQQDTRREVERALSALSSSLDALDGIVYDWAAWDNTYNFIQDQNETYVSNNLVDSTFTGLWINYLLYFDADGELVRGKGFDLETGTEMPVPAGLKSQLAPDSILLQHDTVESHIAGLLALPEAPLIVAARPIITSNEEGPIRGTLIMGRYFDEAEVERLGQTIFLSLTIHRYNDINLPADFQAARDTLLKGDDPIAVTPINDKQVGGYTLLYDVNDAPVLLLRVDLSRNVWRQGQTSVFYFIISLLLVGLISGAVTIQLLNRFVLSRLARLNSEVGYIGSSGSFVARVTQEGSDELTDLAVAINQMLGALKRSQTALKTAHDELEQRVEERTAELTQTNEALLAEITERTRAQIAEREQRAFAEALREVTGALTSTLDLDEVLEGILANVGLVVQHDAANIMLVGDGVARVMHCRGYANSATVKAMRSRPFIVDETPNQRKMVETQWPVVIPDTHADPEWRDVPESRWVRSYVGVPIILSGEVIGFINLDSGTPGFFSNYHGDRMRAFADQAAVALENAQLYNQAKVVAAMEERARLANELHDAVSQMLFSASLVTDVLPTLWEQDEALGRQSLGELRTLIQGALAEMRTLLLELRPSALEEANLDNLLRQLGEAVAGRTGVEVNVDVTLRHSPPPDEKITIYRVAQEALNNVVRHSGANRVRLELEGDGAGVRLKVIDNGCGFDPNSIPAGHFGVGIMHERAESIGATLNVTSAPGSGTAVEMVWIYPSEEKVNHE